MVVVMLSGCNRDGRLGESSACQVNESAGIDLRHAQPEFAEPVVGVLVEAGRGVIAKLVGL